MITYAGACDEATFCEKFGGGHMPGCPQVPMPMDLRRTPDVTQLSGKRTLDKQLQQSLKDEKTC